MRFKLEFNCETSAFDGRLNEEIVRILRDLSVRVHEHKSTSGNIHDNKGNTIGSFRLIRKEDRP